MRMPQEGDSSTLQGMGQDRGFLLAVHKNSKFWTISWLKMGKIGSQILITLNLPDVISWTGGKLKTPDQTLTAELKDLLFHSLSLLPCFFFPFRSSIGIPFLPITLWNIGAKCLETESGQLLSWLACSTGNKNNSCSHWSLTRLKPGLSKQKNPVLTAIKRIYSTAAMKWQCHTQVSPARNKVVEVIHKKFQVCFLHLK